MKIGGKLLFSYGLIIVLCFGVGFMVFGYLSRQYLVAQAREDLISQGEALARIIGARQPVLLDRGDGDSQKTDDRPLPGDPQDMLGEPSVSEIYSIQRKQMQLAGSLVDTRLILFNSRGEVAYSNLEPRELELFKASRDQRPGITNFIVEEFPVAGPAGESGAVLVLAASLEDMNRINNLNFRAQLYSVLAALLLALLLGWFFEGAISRPLGKLTRAMQGFRVSEALPELEISSRDEIGELARCFEQMGRELQRYDQLQKALLQNTSHELKTPLMSIQGYAEAIRDGVVEGPEVEASLNIIIEESQRLKEMVSSLLYLSRLDNTEEQFKLEECRVDELVAHALRIVQPLASGRQVEISARVPSQLKAWMDADKMERTLVNIIGNAVRYASSRIEVECWPGDYGRLQIRIQDDGPGFINGEEDLVFERFYKGSSGGSGLGLAIARAIVHGHGGEIQAGNAGQDRPGQTGAVFQMAIPICPSSACVPP